MVQGIEKAFAEHHVVGLTGSFGTGKSTVAHLFEELGAFRVDADALAHEALLKGSEVCQRIIACFPSAESEEGDVDHKKLAAEIFNDEGKRKKVESLIHPYVFQRIIAEVTDASEKIVIVEVPLLFETGFDGFCDETVVVDAEEEQLIERLGARGFSRDEIKARLKTQLPSSEKKEKATFVINNSNNLEETKKQVENIWKKIHSI